jgi:transcriptional regulator GlxA family with amidase domain
LRLDSARRELAAADHAATSVTTIAMQNGFHHLGRFSVGYREHFGESPRETLAAPTLRQ